MHFELRCVDSVLFDNPPPSPKKRPSSSRKMGKLINVNKYLSVYRGATGIDAQFSSKHLKSSRRRSFLYSANIGNVPLALYYCFFFFIIVALLLRVLVPSAAETSSAHVAGSHVTALALRNRVPPMHDDVL